MDDELWAKHEQKMRADYESGNKHALAELISMCATYGRVIPRWAGGEFYRAVRKVERLEVASWDEVFGRPLPKGKRLSAERRKRAMVSPVMQGVARRCADGEVLSKELFVRVGKDVGASGTVVEEVYYAGMKKLIQGIRETLWLTPKEKRDLESEYRRLNWKGEHARREELRRAREEETERARGEEWFSISASTRSCLQDRSAYF
jgi:hypothetical protein